MTTASFSRQISVTWGQRIPWHILEEGVKQAQGLYMPFAGAEQAQEGYRPIVIVAVAVPRDVRLLIEVDGQTQADLSGSAMDGRFPDVPDVPDDPASQRDPAPWVFRLPKPVILGRGADLAFRLRSEIAESPPWPLYKLSMAHPEGALIAWYGVGRIPVP